MRLHHAVIVVAVAGLAAFVVDGRSSRRGADGEHMTARAHALSEQPRLGAGAAALPRDADGHYWAEARVNGARVRFLVDTGATYVALTAADARRVGVDVDDLEFIHPIATAGGQALAAVVTLNRLSVAAITERDVEAIVLREGLDQSLLGMSFLGRLSRIEASRDTIILRR